MLSNILITLFILVLTVIVLSRVFTLPRNIWVLFLAQPLVMSCSPVIVFIGGILSAQMVTDKTLATLPITMMILGVAAGSIPAALLAKKMGRKFAALFGFSITLAACLVASYAVYIALFELFIIASILFGLSTSFVQQLRFAAIESTADEKSIPTVISILMLSGIFAAFLGPEDRREPPRCTAPYLRKIHRLGRSRVESCSRRPLTRRRHPPKKRLAGRPRASHESSRRYSAARRRRVDSAPNERLEFAPLQAESET